MESQDFLNYSLGVGFLILVGFISWVLYLIAQTIQKMHRPLDDIDSVGHDLRIFKDKAKHEINKFFIQGGEDDMPRQKSKKGLNALTAGAIGATAGALSAAAASLLADTNNRKAIGNKLKGVKDQAASAINDLSSEAKKYQPAITHQIGRKRKKKTSTKVTRSKSRK